MEHLDTCLAYCDINSIPPPNLIYFFVFMKDGSSLPTSFHFGKGGKGGFTLSFITATNIRASNN